MVSRKSREPHLTPIAGARADAYWAAATGAEPSAEQAQSDLPAGRRRPADRAYQGIRRAILTGELKSGEHLREEQLAQMTGTSRTPVRDALSRLVAEGLATQENRHRFVADFSYEEVTVVFDLRAKVEGYAASMAAQRITAAEIETLRRIVGQIDNLVGLDGETAAERFVTLNTEFHSVVVQAARSRQLQTLSAKAFAVPLIVIKLFVWDERINITHSNAQHKDIVEALARHNSEWAEHAMTGHIISTKPKVPRRLADFRS